jgi:hypothetical protein
MRRFDALVVEFLAADKVATRRFRWTGRRIDWVTGGGPLVVENRPYLKGRLSIGAHLYRQPPKYSFSLLFRRERVLGLDVDPGLSHTNGRTLEVVFGTHWQQWAFMDAVSDSRSLIYQRWLEEFLERSKISLRIPPMPPPVGAQLRLEI